MDLITTIIQAVPNFDFKIFGAFGICLSMMGIAIAWLIKQISFYRDQLESVRSEKNDTIDSLRQEKEDLQKERRAETQATIQALQETKQILKAQLDSGK